MSYSSTILADTPVSYWKLDDITTVALDSQSINTGTYNGGYTQSVAGFGSIDGTATTFNGSTGYVSVPNASNLQLVAPFTLEALIKTSTTSAQGIVEKYTTTPFPGYGLRINPNGNINGSVGFWVGDNTNGWVVAPVNVADGNWHHIAATLVSTTLSIYIDGYLAIASNRTPSLTTTNQLTIGRSPQTSSGFFNGTIDNVAVYSSALSAPQIKTHFAAVTESGAVRITQAPIRTLISPSDQAIRIAQAPVRTLIKPTDQAIRVTQMSLRILRLSASTGFIKIPFDGLKNNSDFSGF